MALKISTRRRRKVHEKLWKFNMFEPPVLLWDSPDYLVTVVVDQILIWFTVVNQWHYPVPKDQQNPELFAPSFSVRQPGVLQFWAQNLRLNPGPTADAPWLLVVRWKPVSLRSSSPWRDYGKKVYSWLMTAGSLITLLISCSLISYIFIIELESLTWMDSIETFW